MTALLVALGLSPAVVEVDASRRGARVPPGLYGIFLEEINNAGDGGLYAELIQNRGFEDANAPPACTVQDGVLRPPQRPHFWEGRPTGWTMPWPYASLGPTPYWSVRGAEWRVVTDRPLTPASPHALQLDARPGATLTNEGYWGMNVRRGEGYDLSLFTASEGYQGPLEARLVAPDGTVLARSLVRTDGAEWTKRRTRLVATRSHPQARFSLVAKGTGRIRLDFISLMPARKWRGLPLRPDLAGMIADLKPGFVRWPGGCVVEGIAVETRPRWEETLGPLEGRVPTFSPWGYWTSNGFGYHEWLLFCEAIRAEPLYVFNSGMSCAFRSGTFVPDDELEPLVQNTLDAIEYAVGPVTSKYGAMRARAGHPKPFRMSMVEIGNEAVGPEYGARVRRFMDAIKAKYPKMKVALSSWVTGLDLPAIQAAGPRLDVVDEHAYRPAGWAIENFDHFASYPRDVPWSLYIGEFATNGGVGRGNVRAMLGDAAYMMSMEKNADLVTMGSYAPLLENTNRRQWEVNLIHFDSARAYGRASYHACKLFADHLPSVNLATSVEYAPPGEAPIQGAVGLGTWLTSAEFRDVQVNGTPLSGPRFAGGRWSQEGDVIRQTDREPDRWSYFGDGYRDVTLTLQARKVAGEEGFLVSVGNAEGRRVQFNVGGWGNRQHGIEAAGIVRQVPGSVETGRWYGVRVETRGRTVRAYLDGKLIFDETLPRTDRLLAVAGRDDRTGEVIVKVLNTGGQAVPLELAFKGATVSKGTVTRLHADDPEAENSYAEPRRIAPKRSLVRAEQGKLREVLPPYSLSLYRLATFADLKPPSSR